MTRPIQDWRDAYETLRFSTMACLDALPDGERERHAALASQAEDGTWDAAGVPPSLTLNGATALDARRKLYEQAIDAIVSGSEREAQLLRRQHDDRNWVKSLDEVKGCVDLVTRIFGIPRHAVMDDVSALYMRKFGGDD